MGRVCRWSSSCTPRRESCCTFAPSLRWRCTRQRSRYTLSRRPLHGARYDLSPMKASSAPYRTSCRVARLPVPRGLVSLAPVPGAHGFSAQILCLSMMSHRRRNTKENKIRNTKEIIPKGNERCPLRTVKIPETRRQRKSTPQSLETPKQSAGHLRLGACPGREFVQDVKFHTKSRKFQMQWGLVVLPRH